MRNTMRSSAGSRALREASAAWISVAQRTASTALPNSASTASPAVLKMRPRCVLTSDSKISRGPRNTLTVRSSLAPISWL
jgi:hypothetical protein